MLKYSTVDISEKELEDLIRQYPDPLEKGLVYIDHQRFTDRGPLDMIFVDSGKSLVIAELKVVEEDGMLMQGLDYYDYIARNFEGICNAYKGFNIDTKQDIRLVLIAPSFSVNLLNRCKWLDVNLSLYTYSCVHIEELNEKILTFTEVTFPSRPERIEEYKFDDRINYITDEEMRKLAKETLEAVKKWDSSKILIEPTKYSLSLKHSGKVFAYFEPRRKYFLFYTYNEENKWTPYKIDNKEEVEKIKTLMKFNIEKK
ncbi:MAG: hypothetical protein JST62_00765 [Bacteroidetes bacterium]|nr:hypothetical protein [Bacteroidota bacterium]